MKRIVHGIGLALLGGACCVASAAEVGATTNVPVSIEAMVVEALAKNPEIKFYEAEIETARAERKIAGRRPPPEFQGTLGGKTVRGPGVSAEGVAWSASLMQPFEWPGRVPLRKAIANQDVTLAELGLERFRDALAHKVRATGFALLVAQERLAASSSVADRLKELRDVLVARDPAGLTPLLETRVIEASEVKASHNAAEANHDVEHLAIELNYLRGQAPTTQLRVAQANLRLTEPPPLTELQHLAATNNFELRVRVAELEMQGFKVALARNERYPMFSIGPMISEERAGDRERTVGIAFSVPLPFGQKREEKVAASQSRQKQAEAALESAQRQLERDVADYWHKYEHAIGILGKWRPDAIEHFQEAAELADRHYRLGAVPVSTYVELQRQYVEAVEAILDARKEALESAQRLAQLTGWASPVATEQKEIK